jgi:hypothetical protein
MKNALLRAREPWCLENGKPTVLRAEVRAVQSTMKTGAAAPMGKCLRGDEACAALRANDLPEIAMVAKSSIFALQHAGLDRHCDRT